MIERLGEVGVEAGVPVPHLSPFDPSRSRGLSPPAFPRSGADAAACLVRLLRVEQHSVRPEVSATSLQNHHREPKPPVKKGRLFPRCNP